MENLTKEGFWNELYEKYPKAMKLFCDWIDEYKKKNNWNELFNAGEHIHFLAPSEARITITAPKYHDLPLAMQAGIWIEFISEQRGAPQFDLKAVTFTIDEDLKELELKL